MAIDCIFCKIINNEIPSKKVLETDDVLAFLDINPANKEGGHVLIIPKKHYINLVDVPNDVLYNLMDVIKKITRVLMNIYDGVNLISNNGSAAGQVIEHLHFHLIPRKKEDGLSLGHWEMYKYKEGQIEEIQEKIKKLLNEIKS